MLRTLVFTLFVLGLAAPGLPAQEPDTATTGATAPVSRRAGTDGWGVSAWGWIPPPADSVTVRLHEPGRSAWEHVLLVPYRVIAFPIALVNEGLQATVEFLGTEPRSRYVRKLVEPIPGPLQTRIRLQTGGLSGFGGGVTIWHMRFFGEDNRFRAGVESTTRGDTRLRLGVRLGEDAPNRYEAALGFRSRPNARYFGIGPEAPESAESFFDQDITWYGASYRRRLGGDLSLEGEAIWSRIEAEPTDDEEPRLEDRFAGALPPGFGGDSRGLTLGIALEHDDTRETGRPDRGGVRRISFERFESTDRSDLGYSGYRAELQQFVSVGRPRVLAARAFLAWLDPGGGETIPFQRLIVNDDPDLLRGFRDFRWRDRGLTAIHLEYRWPVWAIEDAEGTGLDAYLLTDVGQVFGEIDEIALDRLQTSWGGGLRLVLPRGFVGRLEFARSDEESVVRLRADQLFQFSKRGLYGGRDPIPSR